MLKLLPYIFLFLTTGNILAQIPTWTSTFDSTNTFSSPRCIDLNGDNTLDIIIGGANENQSTELGIIALDGTDGSTLWQVASDDQIFTSAIFQDINGDATADVFIGGRNAIFKAIDGSTGAILWNFSPENQDLCPADTGWYNFYNAQLIPDQNNDGINDLLTANGGYTVAEPNDTLRPPGHLIVLSGLDGALLAKASMPDNKETYVSPVVSDLENDGILDIIFGSGGETIGGAIWRASLSDLMNNDLSSAIPLYQSSTNGYIAPPSLADFNNDGILDILASSYDNTIVAIDGNNHAVLWSLNIDNTEIAVNACIGQFNNDGIPDVFTVFSVGEWVAYDYFIKVAIDGSDGSIFYQDSIPSNYFQLFSYTAVDINNDGIDEIIDFIHKKQDSYLYSFDIIAHDVYNNNIHYLLLDQQGYNIASTPYLNDIDNDGLLEIIYAYSKENNLFSHTLLTLGRLDLDLNVPSNIAWGSYMGSAYNSIYYGTPLVLDNYPDPPIIGTTSSLASLQLSYNNKQWHIINPTTTTPIQFILYNLQGQAIQQLTITEQSYTLSTAHLPNGIYLYHFNQNGINKLSGKIAIE